MALRVPNVGVRLRLGTHLGTVRFVGTVTGSQGTWLGIEWDNPKRGKHDGTKDGIRYFSCLVPGSGSFIRPTVAIEYGQSFLAALKSKYVESLQGGNETVILGSSNGAIEVDVVNLDLIRRNLALLDKLRAVSLEDVCDAEPPGTILKSCPNISSLDLSFSLLTSWDTVIAICTELPLLERLQLNHTRLAITSDAERAANAFLQLEELSLNGTMMPWSAIVSLISYMPKLNSLEAGLNTFRSISTGLIAKDMSCLQSLNLDNNSLSDWVDICQGLRQFGGLRRLNLTSNGLSAIPPLTPELEPYRPRSITNISVSFNELSSWEDVDHLAAWFPELTAIRLIDNPLQTDSKHGKYYWQFTVARMPALEELDGTHISSKERRDCELFYINWISREGPKSEEEKRKQHPRWSELCNKWGRPEEAPPAVGSQTKLRSQLIEITIHRLSASPAPGEKVASVAAASSSTNLKVLRTMSLRTFRAKVSKTFKASRDARLRFWLGMSDDSLAEVDVSNDESGDISWWGLEDGAQVFLFIGI